MKPLDISYRIPAHHNRRFSTNKDIIPAIILGGGPTGLFLSNLLTSYSIPHLLFDKRPQSELLRHPQAHFINLRSMELLRYELPRVYTKIVEGMPDVSEWEAFNFAGSVVGGRLLGRVVHPVSKPLLVGQRGDAKLVTDEFALDTDDCKDTVERMRVSPCQPAHLAQNKFVSLLLKEAQRTKHGKHLNYNQEVVNITEHDNLNSRPLITIHTPNNSYQTKYLLACDGVHSFARKHCKIPLRGEASLQHMMNIHFRTNSALSAQLMKHTKDQAMLHFVYNPMLVGAFVCHDGREGEWVLQVPYFPPYQLPGVDFTTEKVKEMIWYGLLGHVPNTECDFNILSVRSWTMSSQVAERYINHSHNVLLVGDAAHAFPPAGGFGMNTGLQDAHNLAWRLALALRRECSDSMLKKYEQDRKPIATQNAALSVRNYQRTLRIAKACYLDAQHPQLLMGILGSPPMSFLPPKRRQDMFHQLVKVAMMPLGSLLTDANDSIHAIHVEKNVRKILESGGSLPLVFPRYELGFSYASESDNANPADDSAGYYPTIRIGHRIPHVELEVLSVGTKDKWGVLEVPRQLLATPNESTSNDKTIISTVNIASQLRQVHQTSTPLFTLLALGCNLINASKIVQNTAGNVMDKWNISVALINVLRDKSTSNEITYERFINPAPEETECQVEYAVDMHQDLYQLSQRDIISITNGKHIKGLTSENDMNALIMVCPDGHIANVSYIDPSLDLDKDVCAFIEQGLYNSLY